jgi:hypothetical protein
MPGFKPKDPKAYADSVMTANKNLNFVKRYLMPDMYPKLQTNRLIGAEGMIAAPKDDYTTHWMSHDPKTMRVFPQIVMVDGKLQDLGERAYDYADKTGEYIQFETPEEAEWFAANGYKSAGQMTSKPFLSPKTIEVIKKKK